MHSRRRSLSILIQIVLCGIKGRMSRPKVHHVNTNEPSRCFVRLYKLYLSKCLQNRPANTFYLQPLENPTNDCWFSAVPIGYATLTGTSARLCKTAGIPGYETNHSFRTTAATRLYQAGVDKQLIMEKTDHCSLEGVRSYKQTNTEQQEKYYRHSVPL